MEVCVLREVVVRSKTAAHTVGLNGEWRGEAPPRNGNSEFVNETQIHSPIS